MNGGGGKDIFKGGVGSDILYGGKDKILFDCYDMIIRFVFICKFYKNKVFKNFSFVLRNFGGSKNIIVNVFDLGVIELGLIVIEDKFGFKVKD